MILGMGSLRIGVVGHPLGSVWSDVILVDVKPSGRLPVHGDPVALRARAATAVEEWKRSKQPPEHVPQPEPEMPQTRVPDAALGSLFGSRTDGYAIVRRAPKFGWAVRAYVARGTTLDPVASKRKVVNSTMVRLTQGDQRVSLLWVDGEPTGGYAWVSRDGVRSLPIALSVREIKTLVLCPLAIIEWFDGEESGSSVVR